MQLPSAPRIFDYLMSGHTCMYESRSPEKNVIHAALIYKAQSFGTDCVVKDRPGVGLFSTVAVSTVIV